MPSGAQAPEEADGLDLRRMAEVVTARYALEFPDEDERYDPKVWRAWCRHDTQYLLHWGILDARGTARIEDQVGWLARVLAARDFPLDRLARTLELAADVAAEAGSDDAAERLRAATSAARAPVT